MKKLTTISLFIFGVITTAILTAGLVFYQNSKSSNNDLNNNQVKNSINETIPEGQSITLNMNEISKHNKSSDCWVLISGKVYDITSYFGSHPGGNSPMSPTCGIDATAAYATRDPNAKTSNGDVKHSSFAKNLLNDYYVGDFNQVLGNNTKINQVQTVNNKAPNTNPVTVVKDEIVKPVIAPALEVTLSPSEISKHNKQTDCWLLINGKVYNITSYFGSHPGGNPKMLATCGKDASSAYATKNPSATSSGGGSSHSSNAIGLLANYFIGNINQTIGQQKVVDANAIIPPTNNGEYEDEYEDEDW